MMFRLARFLIIWLTLGRIKWLMRLTWVWRLVVFLGISGWLSKRLRRAIGLDKGKPTDVDSAWAEALRYTPTPSTAFSGASASGRTGAAPEVSDTVPAWLSEVTGSPVDGTTETVTVDEVSTAEETETIVRVDADEIDVENSVSNTSVEEVELPVLSVEEAAVEAEIEAEAAIDEILDTLEAAEPQSEVVEETVVEEVVVVPAIEPDWVRGDGSHECPDSHPVKAKASSMIYYIPESGHYERTIPDVCFASEIDAEASGYRAPRR